MASRPSKRRKLTPPNSDEERVSKPYASSGVPKAFLKNAAKWNLEQDYEAKPRKGRKGEKAAGRLPIKNSDGVFQDVDLVEGDKDLAADDAKWLEDYDDEHGSQVSNGQIREAPQIPEREQILKVKEELAKIALKLNEHPEDNPGAFKQLAQAGRSELPSVRKLCLVTQMAVYKDVIPGYRIRPAPEDSKGEKLSKDVRTLHAYEQALISGYQAYIKELARLSKGGASASGTPANDLADVAISCACTLLNSVPHFNFRGDLLRILVAKLSRKQSDKSFIKCRKALETLFREDEEGRPSMEAVSLLTKMMKARDYNINESALNLFLYLRLLSEYSGKASQDTAVQDKGVLPLQKPKAKREVRTKRERKFLKEQKGLDRDMAQADALVSHEEREHMQSETLKLVFATYFRILKQRSPHLTGAVLEGLGKYAHLINQDFFGDLLEALKDLIRHSNTDEADDDSEEADEETSMVERNPSREALLCVVTAFALLAGQDAHNARTNLHLDLSFFTTRLFLSILSLSLSPDLELGARSLHLPDPDNAPGVGTQNNKVNFQTTTVLLVRCLTAVLLPPYHIRSVPPLRLAAFTKQLMSASLHLPEKSCQAVIALLHDVSHAHGKKISALWNTEDRKGDGTFNALSETIEGSNPFTATVWEGEILRKHFCPKVREGVKALNKRLPS